MWDDAPKSDFFWEVKSLFKAFIIWALSLQNFSFLLTHSFYSLIVPFLFKIPSKLHSVAAGFCYHRIWGELTAWLPISCLTLWCTHTHTHIHMYEHTALSFLWFFGYICMYISENCEKYKISSGRTTCERLTINGWSGKKDNLGERVEKRALNMRYTRWQCTQASKSSLAWLLAVHICACVCVGLQVGWLPGLVFCTLVALNVWYVNVLSYFFFFLPLFVSSIYFHFNSWCCQHNLHTYLCICTYICI